MPKKVKKKAKAKKPKPRTVTTTTTSRVVKKVVQRNPMADLSVQEEDLLAALLLVAENQGEFYPDRPDASVDKAVRDYRRQAREDLNELLLVVRPLAVTELRKRWKRSMVANPKTRKKNSAAVFALGAVAGWAVPKIIEGTKLRIYDYGPNHFEWRSGSDSITALRKGKSWLFSARVNEVVVASKKFTNFQRGVEWGTAQLNKPRNNPTGPTESELIRSLKF